jgi:hypothetical protein
LRLQLRGAAVAGHVDGAWWPQSRDLQTEAADLVDHIPHVAGRINRLLFSRPDWDDGVVEGRGLRRIHAARGPVKVGSFPSDDTHQMVLMMASGARLRLLVVPWDTSDDEAQRVLRTSSAEAPGGRATATDRT